MKAVQRLFTASHPAGVEPLAPITIDEELMRQLKARAAKLPIEGHMPSFDGAVTWLNSEPLTPEGLRGRVVAVDFWTYTCVNWLRTLPYVRAWAEKYRDKGLTVIGVHTPEFPFEKDLDNIRREVKAMRVEYPIAVDSDYGVWQAFDNNYWPALYVVDAQGQIRAHQYGEGAYEMSEMIIQQLLADAGFSGFTEELVSVHPKGLEVAADWSTLESGETYVGYQQAEGFASPGVSNRPHEYSIPDRLRTNEWALSGDWTVAGGFAALNQAPGRIAFRFHGRDVNLVMGPDKRGGSARFRVFLDGKPPGTAHGTDVDENGQGTVAEQRTQQLIRQTGTIDDRTFEIEFLEPGVEAYCFTFG
jgi:thiol-disulfide isomerase/thioredoxin